jgi:hypothetical protein
MSGFPVNADQTGVAPPQGSAPLLEVVVDGVQIYTCEAKGSLFQWTFTAPEANLFDKQGRQIGTHFAGPIWKMADGSAIVGEFVTKADAPEKDAIQWLLLRTKAHEGQGILADAAFIRRTETKGRSCADNRLRRKPYFRAGAHAVLRDLSVLQRGKGVSKGVEFADALSVSFATAPRSPRARLCSLCPGPRGSGGFPDRTTGARTLPKGYRRLGGSSKRRLSSQHQPVIWPCGNGPLRLSPRSGTGGHARNGELIALAYRRDPKLAVIGWYRSGLK